MLLSGPWRGYWDQEMLGRQMMHDLVLRFADGAIEGEGRDCIGRFTFRGRYGEDGAVTMVKAYLGRHRVRYDGTCDGEGTIFGRWSIAPHWSGPFALTPIYQRPPADTPIQDL